MDMRAWYRERNDRTLRYAGRVLPPDRPILLKLDNEYARRYDGQVAIITAANLLARMTPSVSIEGPDVEIVPPLPWAGRRLRQLLTEIMFGADPAGYFQLRSERPGDYVLSLGATGMPTVHGSGWNAYIGRGPSPLSPSDDQNPVGPALAVIAAVALLFGRNLDVIDSPHLLSGFYWRSDVGVDIILPKLAPFLSNLGSIWSVGVGSVGTAALYFLTLVTRRFSSTLFDMDFIKVENLDRSPIFLAADADGHKRRKVDASFAYLRSVGVSSVTPEPLPLDESKIWFAREAGTPDLLISAANERNVRYAIEQSAPPIQIYGTTGANWEASVIRHIPLVDPCSCCLFPPDAARQMMKCATETCIEEGSGQTVDAALPFLSFAAGLMTAAEILKTQLPGYPFSSNRTTLYTHPDTSLRFVSPRLQERQGCLCHDRSASVHRRMIQGSKYVGLSDARRTRQQEKGDSVVG